MVQDIPSEGKVSSELIEAALKYAGRGWRVLPLHHIVDGKCSCNDPDCEPRNWGKHPRISKWTQRATTDAQTIRQWWRRWPLANIAIHTGKDSGIWMLGPDGPEGIEALAELVHHYGELPRTPTAQSGSGGQHDLFRWPTGGGIINDRNHRDVPIDIRGEGGYFIAAPSRNKNGDYVWQISPDDCDVAEAPEWLLDWCRTKKRSAFRVTASQRASIEERARKYLAKIPGAVSGQGGHPQTFKAARAVVYGFDLGPEVGFRILSEDYNPRCKPEWSEKEIRHKCEEADSKAYWEPRGWLLKDSDRGSSSRTQKDRADPIDEQASLQTRTLAGMRPKPIRWIVPGYIPLGKVVLFAGDGGHGKSTLTLYLAACRSRGLAAFGLEDAAPLTCETLLIQCEDD
jgi:hypothetical protein